MNINKKLELLEKIERAEVPPFLFTRIKERVAAKSIQAPVTWKLAFTLTAFLVLAFNAYYLFRTDGKSTSRKEGLEEVISSMHLSSSNELYHE